MDRLQTRLSMLAHCMELAKLDPVYAMHAADWYEENEPWVFERLGAKVRQEVARAIKTEAPQVRAVPEGVSPGTPNAGSVQRTMRGKEGKAGPERERERRARKDARA